MGLLSIQVQQREKTLTCLFIFLGFFKRNVQKEQGDLQYIFCKSTFYKKKSRRRAAQDVSDLLVCLAGQRGEKLLRGCPEENSQHGQGVSDVLRLSAVGNQEIIDAVIDDGGAK